MELRGEEVERLVHEKGFWRLAYRQAQGDKDIAEEAMGNCAIIALEKLPMDIDRLRRDSWFGLTLKREVWRLGGRRRAGHAIEGLYGMEAQQRLNEREEVDKLVIQSLDHCRFKEAVERLKPQERQALSDLALGLSYAEIGEKHGWTYTKVNRCLAEGKAALRKALGEDFRGAGFTTSA